MVSYIAFGKSCISIMYHSAPKQLCIPYSYNSAESNPCLWPVLQEYNIISKGKNAWSNESLDYSRLMTLHWVPRTGYLGRMKAFMP